MPKLAEAVFKQKRALFNQLNNDFEEWRPHYQEIADFILPRRYVWLSNTVNGFSATEAQSGLAVSSTGQQTAAKKNSRILDSTGTIAARTLANGMMNGITSPARPWFRLRLTGFPDNSEDYPQEYLIWLEEVTRRMHLVLSESNFYNAAGVMYLDMACFGTAAMLIYEDFDEIIRCYNSPMGEYRLRQDNRRMVDGLTRAFHMQVHQIVKEFGLENCTDTIKTAYKMGGANLLRTEVVCHMVEANNQDDPAAISPLFKYREFYWINSATNGQMLRIKGYHEKPIVAPRWEITGNDTYGTSPSMDALPDIKQLQLETKQKAQSVDKMIRPPIVADIALQTQPTALLPGGVSYVPGSSSIGARAIYTVNPPLGFMTADISELQVRIREIFHNNLFRNVSNLNTVRSAAEIYERKSEDMVLLGSVLERFENEALDPAIRRVFNIMKRKRLLPPIPPGLEEDTLDIQYVSILSDAQRAATSGSLERFMQVIGDLSGAVPEVLTIPDYDELVRQYANRLNVPAVVIKSREEVAALRQQQEEQLAAQNEALVGKELTNAAKNLSDTDLGGGQNAIQALLGG